MADTLPSASWGSFQPGGGGVPASPASSNGGADPIAAMIKDMVTPISSADITAATTPIGGARTGAVPTTFQRPLTHQDMPLDNREVVGAGNARAQGIGNAITSVTNAIGRFVTKQNQVKQDVLKDQATKVIQSQQAIDEAKTQLDMAKQSGDTATVEKMTNLINEQTQTRDAIFAGKHGKDLAKGFDISYTDPEANKTEYHAAVQAAIKDAKTAQERKAAIQKLQQQNAETRGKNMGAAYEKSQPQGLAANTTAQARVQMALQARKDAVDMIKALSPERVAEINQDTRLRTAAMTQATELQKQQMTIADRTMTRQQNFQEREKLLGVNDANITKRMYLNNNLILSREKELIKARMNDPDTLFKTAEASARAWDQQQRSAQQRLDTANTNLANLQAAGKGPGTPEYTRGQALVNQATEDLQMTQDQADFSTNQYNYALTLVGRAPIPGAGSRRTGDDDATVDGDNGSNSPIPGSSFTDFLDLGSNNDAQ